MVQRGRRASIRVEQRRRGCEHKEQADKPADEREDFDADTADNNQHVYYCL